MGILCGRRESAREYRNPGGEGKSGKSSGKEMIFAECRRKALAAARRAR